MHFTLLLILIRSQGLTINCEFHRLSLMLLYFTLCISHRFKFKTKRQAAAAIFEYIEVFYNRVRIHSQLGYTSPAQFRRNNQAATAA